MSAVVNAPFIRQLVIVAFCAGWLIGLSSVSWAFLSKIVVGDAYFDAYIVERDRAKAMRGSPERPHRRMPAPGSCSTASPQTRNNDQLR